jgi:hypothetical protein
MKTSIKKEEIGDGEDRYYVYTAKHWNCEMNGEVIPLAFVVEFMHASVWGDKEDYWECTCGITPATKDIEEDLNYHGYIPIDINSINPQEKLPFAKKGKGWIIKDENRIDEAAEIAKGRAEAVMGLIGFYLDAPYNQIGQTGWDILNEWRGKDTFKDFIDRKVKERGTEPNKKKEDGKGCTVGSKK